MTFRACPGGSKKRRMLNTGVSAPPFTPASLFASGEKGVWYDPSNFTTMWQDSARTTPVTAVGQPVGAINDLSGNNAHATQVTTTSRPVLQQDGGGRFYLSFDGVDDFLVTSTIDFTATAQMTVWAGITKLSDTSFGVIAELGPVVDTTNRTFSLGVASATGDASRRTYISSLNGTSLASYGESLFASPNTAVLSTLYDISGAALASEVFPRVNATIPTLTGAGATAGTGTFGNFVINIGRRNGTSAPLNGNLYSLIVRGANSSAGQILSTELYVNSKTGAF